MPNKKRESSREDQPMMRVLRQRELVDQMHHDNEVLRLDLNREGNASTGTNNTTINITFNTIIISPST